MQRTPMPKRQVGDSWVINQPIVDCGQVVDIPKNMTSEGYQELSKFLTGARTKQVVLSCHGGLCLILLD